MYENYRQGNKFDKLKSRLSFSRDMHRRLIRSGGRSFGANTGYKYQQGIHIEIVACIVFYRDIN